jgi:predicted RNase H-like nuclease (RuvC/YqgF family)
MPCHELYAVRTAEESRKSLCMRLSWASADERTEREVKRAMRDLNQSMSGVDNLNKIEQLQKKCSTLYAEMKRQERELQKQKKRADLLQKEKDTAKSELSKATSMKEKLEKLSRETNNENRKLRVC